MAKNCTQCHRTLPALLFFEDSPTCKQCDPLNIDAFSKSVKSNDEDIEQVQVRRVDFPQIPQLNVDDDGDSKVLVWKRNDDVAAKFKLTSQEEEELIQNIDGFDSVKREFRDKQCYLWNGKRGNANQLHVTSVFKTVPPYVLIKVHTHGLPKQKGNFHCSHQCKSITGIHSRGLCVNPLHLEWETAGENANVKTSDGHIPITHRYGEAHLMNKYSIEQILGALQDEKTLTMDERADKWHLPLHVISDLNRGKTWSFLTENKQLQPEVKELYVAETYVHNKREIQEVKPPEGPTPFQAPPEKKCGQCGETKTKEEFYERGGGVLSDCCRICHSQRLQDLMKSRTEEAQETGMKKCEGPECQGKSLPIGQFNWKNKAKGILRKECKNCQVILNKRYRNTKKADPDPTITEKYCNGCQEIHPIDAFYLRATGKYESSCRAYGATKAKAGKRLEREDDKKRRKTTN